MINLIKILPILLALQACGDGPTSLVRYNYSTPANVVEALGQPFLSSMPAGDWDAYDKYCVESQSCRPGYARLDIDDYIPWTPGTPVACFYVCICVIKYKGGYVSSCTGCVEDLCKI